MPANHSLQTDRGPFCFYETLGSARAAAAERVVRRRAGGDRCHGRTCTCWNNGPFTVHLAQHTSFANTASSNAMAAHLELGEGKTFVLQFRQQFLQEGCVVALPMTVMEQDNRSILGQ